MEKPKVIIVVGPTSSGKSDLAVNIAKTFNGEVISADSRQIYQKLNLGSGKITTEEKKGISHYLLDIIPPETPFSGNDFKELAHASMTEILKKNKLPIITGGTFFYIDILLEKIKPAPVHPNQRLREELETLETAELFSKLQKKDLAYSQKIDKNNRRRLIRALEILNTLDKIPEINTPSLDFSPLKIGIKIEKNILEQRIKDRLENRLEKGLISEVKNLLKEGVSPVWLTSLGLEYKFVTEYLNDKITLEEMKEQIIIKSRQYAKRQYTWLKRDKDILWFDFPLDFLKVKNSITDFLK